MPLPYEAKYVTCPFFCKSDSNRIVCEGLFDGNNINLTFKDTKKKGRYMERHCNSIEGCSRCRVHMILEKKYDE